MKADEARERNDRTGSIIAIDLSAIHLRGGRRKEGDKWMQKKKGVKPEYT